MSCSRIPGPQGCSTLLGLLPARTRGPMGWYDQADPDFSALLGDTCGPLGWLDHGDPNMLTLGMGSATVAPKQGLSAVRDYLWGGKFDRTRLRAGFTARFSADAHYGTQSIPHLETLIGLIEADVQVSDLRWMAYMLATAYWETSHTEVTIEQGKNKKGTVVSKKHRHWVNMTPVEESGHGVGRDYYLPVKVLRNADGSATVTEQDGDKFIVGVDGKHRAVNADAERGSAAGDAAVKAYRLADGAEWRYFGRGYVQLTWWDNYASTGAKLGLGLGLLFDPDKALDVRVAYDAMSMCMRTGWGFANGHKFSNYFNGSARNYIGARRMVNGNDHSGGIAEIANRFEDVLYDARAL